MKHKLYIHITYSILASKELAGSPNYNFPTLTVSHLFKIALQREVHPLLSGKSSIQFQYHKDI